MSAGLVGCMCQMVAGQIRHAHSGDLVGLPRRVSAQRCMPTKAGVLLLQMFFNSINFRFSEYLLLSAPILLFCKFPVVPVEETVGWTSWELFLLPNGACVAKTNCYCEKMWCEIPFQS